MRKLRQRLDFAYRKAQEQAKKTGTVYKHYYDETARSSVLMSGDLVLVQKVGVKGKHKIGDKWEHDPYIVISQPNDDIPVYQSPLILTALFQHNLINVSYLTACYLYQVMMTLHFLYVVANDAESTQK